MILVFRVTFDIDPNPNAIGFGSFAQGSSIRIHLGLKIRIGLRILIRKKSLESPTLVYPLQVMKPVGVAGVSQEEVEQARHAFQLSCLKLADHFLPAKVQAVFRIRNYSQRIRQLIWRIWNFRSGSFFKLEVVKKTLSMLASMKTRVG